MRYALIGCGRIAKNHVAAAVSNRLDAVGLCDVIPENAQRYQDQLDCPIYTDYRQMLAAERPDFVAIATESGKHAAIALDCIRAGVNVLIEKPVALSMADAQAIIDAARTAHVTVGVCHQNRFNKAVQKLRRAFEEGRFGRVYNISAVIRWNREEAYYRQAAWRGTWEQDGGCLMNQCIHNIDLLRWFGGEAASVFGVTNNFSHPYIQGEDFGTAIVRFTSGAAGTLEGTVNVYPRNLEETLTVFGERGTVKLGGHSVNTILEWSFADGKDSLADVQREFTENPPDIYGFGHTPLYADFVAAIAEKRQPYVTAEDGKNALEMVLAIYRSSKEQAETALPLENCGSLDFTGLFGPDAKKQADHFIRKTSSIEPSAVIGRGTKIWHYSHVQAGAVIGENCVLGQNVNIGPGVTIGDGCKIQNNVSIYTGVTLEDHVFCGPSCVFTNDLTPRAEFPKGEQRRIQTLVKRGASIGANATIVCGVTIGAYALVGAGAVVTRDVPDYALVTGVPARVVGRVDQYGNICEKNG